MKMKLLLGGAVLASTFALNSVTAVAMLPNSTTARACLNDTTCNTDTTATGISGGGFSSKASVDGYTLHSYSEYRPRIEVREINPEIAILGKPEDYNKTSAHSSVYQNFVALNDGRGQVTFSWDGSLQSNDPGIEARFSFAGNIFKNGSGIRNFNVGNGNPRPGNTRDVDRSRVFNFNYKEGDIISIAANLTTSVNRFSRNEEQCEDRICTARLLDDVYPLGKPIAFADFSNTGSFSITGGRLQAVPVPAAVWFLGSALLGLVGFSRKKATA